jgi:hypothetical protein
MNHAPTPSPEQMYALAVRVGALLHRRFAYLHARRYHFALEDGWSIAIQAESAGRVRVEACRWCRPVATLWSRADDPDRLAGLVIELAGEIDGVLLRAA